MSTFKIRVRTWGQTVIAVIVDANNVSEAIDLATAGMEFKSIAGVSLVK